MNLRALSVDKVDSHIREYAHLLARSVGSYCCAAVEVTSDLPQQRDEGGCGGGDGGGGGGDDGGRHDDGEKASVRRPRLSTTRR